MDDLDVRRERLQTLSPRERQVLVLRAQGATLAEIAASLVVEPRMVKFHLGNIYRRLGITHRSQGARQMALTTFGAALTAEPPFRPRPHAAQDARTLLPPPPARRQIGALDLVPSSPPSADRWTLPEPVLTAALGRPRSWELADYLGRGGYQAARQVLSAMAPEDVLGVVAASKLRGRGGGGFPTGQKWQSTAVQPGPRYLVVNADESEPGTFSNRIALDADPHLLLEGMLLCAFAVGIQTAFVYIRGENVHGFEVLAGAVREATAAGILGPRTFGTRHQLDVVIHRGAGAYICGEETALMESLEGKRGQPRPPHPYQVGGGLFGRPTVVNNVETLLCIPPILARGAPWFAGIGSPDCPGPKVYCVSGHVIRPGVYEAPMGLRLRDLIYGERYGQGVPGGRAVKAVSPGALSAPLLSATELDVRLDTDALRVKPSPNSQLGAGGVIVYDDSVCAVELLQRTEHFFAAESCGKCVPCREGTRWMADLLDRVCAGAGRRRDLSVLGDVATNLVGMPAHQRTLCALGDFAAGPVLAALAKFPADFEHHIREGRCPLACPAAA